MATELRKTGISVIGDIPWGTHFCSFYNTRDDLLDILLPYFQAGLESQEYCLWIISNSELLSVEDAIRASRNSIPELDRYLAKRSLEIIGHDEWFQGNVASEPHRIAKRFREKLNDALARGYAGMRFNGSPAWLIDKADEALIDLEGELDQLLPQDRIIGSCTYPLTLTRANHIFDVAQKHTFAIARRNGNWEVLETPQLKEAKAEIKRLNDELEQRVVARTNQLTKVNEELRREISERKQTEALLQATEQEFRAIVENAPDQILRYDREFRRTYVNPAVLRAYGLPKEKLVGKRIGSVISDADLTVEDEELDKVRQTIAAVFETGKSYEYEVSWPTPSGRKHYGVRLFPELDVNSSVVNVLGIARDITESKEAEQKLREYEKAVEGLDEMMIVVSRDYRYLLANRAFLAYRGLDREALVGQKISEALHPGVFENIIKARLDQCFAGDVVKYEMKYTYPTLGERHLLISYFPIEGSTGIDRAVCILKDITESKQAEQRLRTTSEQLRALSARLQAAREEQATHIAREIHDELGAALSSLRWDLEDFDEAVSESGDWLHLPQLRKKIGSMMALTDTTINTVRRIASELRPISLDALGLSEAIEWQARQFQERTGITVHCDCTLDLDLGREQSTAVFRIFQEALTNILRHAQASTVDVSMKEADGLFILKIADDGRGITDEEKSGAHTLGLLGMRERVLLFAGEVEISGSNGKGTTVIVRIPIARAKGGVTSAK